MKVDDPYFTESITGFFTEPKISDGEIKALTSGQKPAESAEERMEADRASVTRQMERRTA